LVSLKLQVFLLFLQLEIGGCPIFENLFAVASPIPELAPVITINSFIIFLFFVAEV